jgi:hypothetical protein
MLEATVKEAFEKVKAGFDLPFDVSLASYKTGEEAEKALGRKIENCEFAFSDYDPPDSSIVFIHKNWPLKNHSRKTVCLEAVLAEDFGHLQYDSTHEDMREIHVHTDIAMHVYQFWAVRNGVEAGFGDQLLELYEIATTKTKYIPAPVSEIIGVFPALAALSKNYDVRKIIEKYIESLPQETRKEAEKYSFLLDSNSYDDEEKLLRDWKSTKSST